MRKPRRLVPGMAILLVSACSTEVDQPEELEPQPNVEVVERDGTCNAVSVDLISDRTKEQIESGELQPVGPVKERLELQDGKWVKVAWQDYESETSEQTATVICNGRCDENCAPPTGCYPNGGGCTDCGDCNGWWCGPCICTKGEIRTIPHAQQATPGGD